MGCDIHSMVEVRRPHWSGREKQVPGLPWQMGDGSPRWIQMEDEIFPNSWYDPNSESEYFRKQSAFNAVPFNDRNYNLFALLADVRNGYGFAGVPTHDRIEPLSEPRGVPDDASHAWLAVVDGWDVDMHSHTYFTLAELIRYRDAGKLSGQMRRTGAIKGTEYERLQREGGKPTEWCGSVSGGNIITITPDEYDAGTRAPEYDADYIAESLALWKAGRAKREQPWTDDDDKRHAESMSQAGRTYVQYVWEDELFDNAGGVISDVIDALVRYAEDRPPVGKTDSDGKELDGEGWYGHGGLEHSGIRVVMGFDN